MFLRWLHRSNAAMVKKPCSGRDFSCFPRKRPRLAGMRKTVARASRLRGHGLNSNILRPGLLTLSFARRLEPNRRPQTRSSPARGAM
jgi:hypothetical protein